jgi:uncharacterized delta-60 repeat protein
VNGYTPANGFTGIPVQITLQPDGKIVVALDRSGVAQQDPWSNVLRYMPDGSIDNSFGTNGRATAWSAGDDVTTNSVSLQADGKIVFAGHGDYCNQIVCGMDNILIGRFTSQGVIDSTFGTNGQVRAGELFGAYIMLSLGQHVFVLPNGKILVAGRILDQQGGGDVFVLRLNSNGTPDPTFGSSGDGIARLGNYGDLTDMRVEPSGAIYLTGTRFDYADTSNIGDGFVFKLTSSGTWDNSFGTQGQAFVNAAKFDYPMALSIRQDGKIVLGGYIERQMPSSGAPIDTAIVYMLEPNGAISTVIPQGYRFIPLHKPSARIFDIEVGAGNAIFITGTMDTVYHTDAFVGRLNPDASFDYTFSGTGDSYVTYSLGAYTTYLSGTMLYDILRISPSQVLVSGVRNPVQFSPVRVLLMRLNAQENITTGLEPGVNTVTLTAGPNPFFETIRLENPGQEAGRYAVYDNMGRLLAENVLSPGITQVDMRKYPVGLYILVAETNREHCVFKMTRAE